MRESYEELRESLNKLTFENFIELLIAEKMGDSESIKSIY